MTRDEALQILELTTDATPEEIKEAYRSLTKVWHPDRFKHDESLQCRAEAKQKQLNAARHQLNLKLDEPFSKVPPSQTANHQATLEELATDIFLCRARLTSPAEIYAELIICGMAPADLHENPTLLHELTVAKSIRRFCGASQIPVTAHQSLTLAKHRSVSRDSYPGGIPLTDHERAIALQITKLYFKSACRKDGIIWSAEFDKDCERTVRFGERGLTTLHKIGDASGCFRAILWLVFSGATFAAAAMSLVAFSFNGE